MPHYLASCPVCDVQISAKEHCPKCNFETIKSKLRAEAVAYAVWEWLKMQRVIRLVPWAIDALDIAKQEEKDRLLDSLEILILEKSKER